jgi:amino acid transporter
MYLNRNPWIVPIALVAAAIAFYFTFMWTRPGVDHSQLTGNWLFWAVVFIVFAVIALVAYRSLRRSAHTNMDEARSRPR